MKSDFKIYAWSLIETMYMVQSQYDDPVNYLISGDFNRTNIDDIFDSNGSLHQICSVPTRFTSTLEYVITDLHTLIHPATTLPPLEQDEGSKGKKSDHNICIIAHIRR